MSNEFDDAEFDPSDLEPTQGQSDTKPTPRMKFVSVGDMVNDFTPIKWQIKGFIQEHTMMMLFAAPAVGKSLLAVDMACCIATGKDWLGKKTKQGAVAIIAGEGTEGIKKRVQAWQIENGTPLSGAPLFVSQSAETLDTPEGLSQTILSLESLPQKPTLVVLDTLARTISGDENSQQSMGAYVQACDWIKQTYKCTVMIVHHVGVADQSRGRGSSALPAACDTIYRLTNDDADIRLLTCEKFKDAEKPTPLEFELKSVDLGYTDEDGQDQTSVVLSLKGEAVGRHSKVKKLSESRKFALEMFARASYQHKASRDSWRAEFIASHHADGQDSKRRAFDRTVKELTESGLVFVENNIFEVCQSHEQYKQIKGLFIHANFDKTQDEKSQ
jgi:hypothetical protein